VAYFHSGAHRKAEAVLVVHKRLLAKILGENQDLGNQLVTAKNPICPICEVPIDQVRAEGCGISKVKCDLQRVQDRLLALRNEITAEQQSIEDIQREAATLKVQISQVKPRLASLEQTIRALNVAEKEQSLAVREARNILHEVEQYESMISGLDAAEASTTEFARRVEEIKSKVEQSRTSASDTVRHLSHLFGDVLRELIPGEVDGEVKLDGHGLSLKVEYGGDRSTAAIDSLKVVAFDLATLAMSIEGRTCTPSFLLHDSPREADLGLSIYHQLFDFARKLQTYGPSPLFQYIVTTTTEPPKEFLTDEWLRLTIRGAPAEQRLLKVDL
jgi:uncharacterized protein YydD (DUF2326 family)